MKVGFHDVSRENRRRIELFLSTIRPADLDGIALCEVWNADARHLLIQGLGELGYHVRHTRAPWFGFGDGLLLATRCETSDLRIARPFISRTHWTEYFATKRAMAVRVRLDGRREFWWVHTHTGSVGFHTKHDRYDPAGVASLKRQFAHLAQFCQEVRSTEPTLPLILTGDLNCHWSTYQGAGKFMDTLSGAFDDLLRGYGHSSLVFGSVSPQLPTFSRKNPWVTAGRYSGNPDETTDYILLSDPESRLSLSKTEIVFDGSISDFFGESPIVSDHFGIVSRFAWNSKN